jgi:hypothetical protein
MQKSEVTPGTSAHLGRKKTALGDLQRLRIIRHVRRNQAASA